MKIGIIIYDMGNLNSVFNAVSYLGYQPIILQSVLDNIEVDRLILPGVGAFNSGMNNLKKMDWINFIKDQVVEKKIPLLGICLGMQLLAKIGFENGESKGLNLIDGKVEMISTKNKKMKIPHIGWNSVNKKKDSILFKDIDDFVDFYFLHSYIFKSDDQNIITSTFEYGQSFVSSIELDNIYGVQFHPEKSHKNGLKLIRNFIDLS